MDEISRSRRKTKSKLSKKSIELADRSEKKEMKDAERMIQKLRDGLQKLVLEHKAKKDQETFKEN